MLFQDISKYFDKWTFAVLLTLVGTGIILIFSASSGMGQSYGGKQIAWFLFSLAVFTVVFYIKTEIAFRFCFGAYIVLTVILAAQIVTGEIISGTKSWIKTGFFYIQVSEFIKVPLALYLAKTLTKMSIIRWREFFKLGAIIGIPFILIGLQPDMGTAFMLTAFLVFAVILKRIKPIIVVFSIVLLLAGSFVTWNYLLKPYQRDRVISFLNPEKYKKSTGYQIIQSRIAIGSGGLKGKGYLNGTQSQYKFLPTRHTDFIVSVLGEEFGFLGISFLFLLFFTLFYRQFNFKAQSDEEYYFIFLFNGIILFQFLINILMTLGFVPVLGIPLPFVSYGGSSLLAFFIGEALIFRMKINNYLYEDY
jgi:rod shape determining protein RodA